MIYISSNDQQPESQTTKDERTGGSISNIITAAPHIKLEVLEGRFVGQSNKGNLKRAKEGHGPSLLVAVETDNRSARSCGAHASGLGAESMSTANTRREISLLMNRMTYARKQISRKEKGNGKRKS